MKKLSIWLRRKQQWHFGPNFKDKENGGDRIRVKLDCAKGDRAVTGSHLLLAVGRIPNTDDLGLDKAGIATDERGYIRVDDQLARMCPAYGRWVIAMARAHLPTHRTMTLRSLPPICSTMIPAG